jgi:hypothetical protein
MTIIGIIASLLCAVLTISGAAPATTTTEFMAWICSAFWAGTSFFKEKRILQLEK